MGTRLEPIEFRTIFSIVSKLETGRSGRNSLIAFFTGEVNATGVFTVRTTMFIMGHPACG